ncbi:MAG TPA: tRNA lysidine(34) synthetase TilS, partial [Novosphingobium sp.]|nr:tRNA lysidine(34) synthetase TilS [Novosphingobium sp.]
MTARFSADLAALWPGEGRLGLAVSGGPDSLALLLLAHAAMPERIAAATVDHGLRVEAADEAAMVARLCGELGVPHATLRVTVDEGNVQSNARTARYAALADWMERDGLGALATAHHADDQAETLLMRLARGSGLDGLAAMPGVTHLAGVKLVRPLLGVPKARLLATLSEA